MIYRNFSQFESLVWKNGETPAAAPQEEKPKAPEAPKPPSTAPAEQAQKGQAARREGEAEQQQAKAEAEQQLTNATAEPTEAQKQEAAETVDKIGENYPIVLAKFKQDIQDSQNNPDKIEAAKKAFLDAVTQEDKQKLAEALNVITSTKPEETEDSDKTSDALKGAGLGALLEKLIDKLTKLFDKLSGELTKLFGSFEKKTAKRILSPLGGNKKITIAREYEAGKGVTIAADANAEIYSVGGGTVTNIDRNANTVEITGADGTSKVLYKNVIPDSSLKTGEGATQIEAGILIGKAASNDGIQFQFFDSNKTEQNPTENFEKAGLIEEKPKEKEPAKGQTALADTGTSAKPSDASQTSNPKPQT